jgi:hypothetical protein
VNILKKIYNSIAVFFVIRHRDMNKFISFSAIKLKTQIFLLCLLPLLVPIVVLRVIFHVITDKDKDDSIRSLAKVMTIYEQTSEYEYRRATDVAIRIIENIPLDNKEGLDILRYDPIPPEKIIEDFFAFEGSLYQIRPETKEEFVARRIEEEIRQYCEADKPELEKLFQAQYDIIIEKSAGDILKAFYLGLDVLAKKLPIGNSKRRTPPQSIKEVPQPN